MIKSEIHNTEGHEHRAHGHVGTISQEGSSEDPHIHSVEEIEAEHEEGHDEKHDHHQEQRSILMKSRLVPVLVGLIVSVVAIGAQSANAASIDIGSLNPINAAGTNGINRITANSTASRLIDAIRSDITIGREIEITERGVIENNVRIADQINARLIGKIVEANNIVEIGTNNAIAIGINIIGDCPIGIEAETINA